jgi:hypothetical protein
MRRDFASRMDIGSQLFSYTSLGVNATTYLYNRYRIAHDRVKITQIIVIDDRKKNLLVEYCTIKSALKKHGPDMTLQAVLFFAPYILSYSCQD